MKWIENQDESDLIRISEHFTPLTQSDVQATDFSVDSRLTDDLSVAVPNAKTALNDTKLNITILIKSTRETIYVKRNTERRSLKHCHRGKAINVTHSECVSVASVTKHAKRM